MEEIKEPLLEKNYLGVPIEVQIGREAVKLGVTTPEQIRLLWCLHEYILDFNSSKE